LPFNNLLTTKQSALIFNMTPDCNWGYNKTNIIPLIIDFYIRENLLDFYRMYDKNRLILISSKEVFDFLIESGCKLPIKHLALSISDKYRLNTNPISSRCYDVVLMGRQNPILEEYLIKYEKSHPSLKVVRRRQVDGQFIYSTSDGENLGNIDTREKYMNLMCQSKVGLYATPGLDGGEKRTNGFNQVTPRLLEYIVSGCHVIARYPDNSDTKYFELNRFSASVDSYHSFEEQMNIKLASDIDTVAYNSYLQKHYTSVRAKELMEIISNVM
jgi:hypothetical protein